MRALVVDDHEDIAEVLAMLLRRNGYDAETASSGGEAIEKCRAGSFDLVLSDIGMPVMNGFELARQLRTTAGCERMIMIAVTGYSIYDDRKRALHMGFDEIVTKPVGMHALMAMISQLAKTK
jgi:CheY-like chemotaxis protein